MTDEIDKSSSFSIDDFRVTPEQAAEHAAARAADKKPARRRQRQTEEFIQLTAPELDRLRRTRNLATVKLFLELKRLDFSDRHHGKAFTFGNALLGDLGLTRRTKSTGIAELVKLGLITAEYPGGKASVIVTVLEIAGPIGTSSGA